jgi:hypothetical protein
MSSNHDPETPESRQQEENERWTLLREINEFT